MHRILPYLQGVVAWVEGACPRKAAFCPKSVARSHRPEEGKGRAHHSLVKGGARNRPCLPRHTLPIDQAPNIRPVLRPFASEMRGEMTMPYHSEGARENFRNFRQTASIDPLAITYIGLDLFGNPNLCHITGINSKGRRKIRTSCMWKESEFQGTQRSLQIFLRIR